MGKVSRAHVIANEKKPIAVAIKKDVLGFLAGRGVKISSSSPQLIITVGGDGTVLFSKKHYGVPFFAIGSSTSFICQATFANWKSKLPRALQNLKFERRLLLESTLNGKPLPLSLNEIGIRNPEPRVLSIHAKLGKRHFAFRADGFLLSTPTGSPAYCYSCGGKQMKKREWKYQAVAIAPFRRLFSPLILQSSARASVGFSGHETAEIFVDGQAVGKLTEKGTLRVRASSKSFYFAKV